MKYAIVGLVLLLLVAAACSTSTPEPTAQPTVTNTPAAVSQQDVEASAPTPTTDAVYQEDVEAPAPTPTTDAVYQEDVEAPAPTPTTDAVYQEDVEAPTPIPTPQPAAPTATPLAEEPTAITLTDGTGESLTFETRPVRVACLTEICPDIMAELGLEPVAVNDPLSFDPRFFGARADEFRLIGGSFFEPNLEDIAAAEPDLVIGLVGVHDGLREALKSIAPLYIVNPLTYEDSIHYLREIGAAMGHTAEAEEAVQRFLSKLEDYRSRSPGNRTALVMWGSDVNFGIDTEGALVGGLLSEVVGYPWPNPPLDQGGHASGGIQFSLEGVLSVDPDVIFIQTISFPGFEPPPLGEQLAANPLWGELKAVQSGEVYEVSFGLWSTGRGTRSLGLVLDEAMPLLYPDVFGN